jgi:hypothetical protein
MRNAGLPIEMPIAAAALSDEPDFLSKTIHP